LKFSRRFARSEEEGELSAPRRRYPIDLMNGGAMSLRWIGLAAGASLLVLGASRPGAAEGAGAWVHVRVEEPGRQSKVAVNLPVSVVEAALRAAPDTVVSRGRVKLGHHGRDVSVADLRRMWSELKSSGDAEFATVEEEGQKVRIARAGDLVLIHVQKPPDRDAVRVEVPVDVVDALLSGDGEELDVRAAFAVLQKRRGDIVRVNDARSTVRIWIDEGK
jgi:hypothetical protein